MSEKYLPTESYKGVRDFYPEDMAVLSYIFDTWSKTAESFGFERYDASILEPSALYKAKGAENEEMVNEQTYTFTDRGDREVTLRPEMTPTVARMIAGKRRELSFPIRWYSIPNLFRYERPQRGRLREHWQLNCDIFGTEDFSADVEIIALAYQTMINFGAKPEDFEIQINDRSVMKRAYNAIGLNEDEIIKVTRLNDRRNKITPEDYRTKLLEITDEVKAEEIIMLLDQSDEQSDVIFGLQELGITNVDVNRSLSRGFDYYTGTIFEIFDTSPLNNRSLAGGGRYDNLTKMFGGEPISGVGFGIGDVGMRDFLETHNLLEGNLKHTKLTLLPMNNELNLASLKIAQRFRDQGIACEVDLSNRKIDKKITALSKKGSVYIVIGPDEINDDKFEVKSKMFKNENKLTFQEAVEYIKGSESLSSSKKS